MWDRLRTANNGGGAHSSSSSQQQPHQLPHNNKQGRGPLDNGAGTAWGAYYGGGSAHNNRGNAVSAPKYSYSITGGPAPPRPPREFLDQQY